MKKTRSIIESFNYAISGIIYALKTQRNMRIHIITAVLILIASSFIVRRIVINSICNSSSNYSRKW